MYLYGDRKLACLQFLSVWWKGAPSTNENRICGRVNCITYLLWYYNWFSCYELGVILEASRTTYLYSCYFSCVFYIYVSPAYSVISRYVLAFSCYLECMCSFPLLWFIYLNKWWNIYDHLEILNYWVCFAERNTNTTVTEEWAGDRCHSGGIRCKDRVWRPRLWHVSNNLYLPYYLLSIKFWMVFFLLQCYISVYWKMKTLLSLPLLLSMSYFNSMWKKISKNIPWRGLYWRCFENGCWFDF